MIKSNTKDLDHKKRLNPSIRKGTWSRLELYAKINNIDSSSHSVILEKIIHDHCDYLQIPDPFDKVLKN